MHLFNHGLSHYFSKVIHHHHHGVLYHTSPVDAWPDDLVGKPDQFIEKIESCSAHTMTPGHDDCHPVVDKEHYHTFLRVTLAPSSDHSGETVFIERVLLQQGKTTHSVIPVATDAASPSPFPSAHSENVNGDELYDHACIVLEGSPSSLLHTHRIHVDRTVDFTGCADRRLSLYELATLLRFISVHGLRAVSIGVDTACETYSKWFSRATLSALAPPIMRGAFQRLTPRPGLEEGQIEIALQRSVNAWLRSTYKAYPLEKVATENLARQLDAMSEGERAQKMERIAEDDTKKDRELMFQAMTEAAERVRDTWDSELAQWGEGGTKPTRPFVLSVDSSVFKAMEKAALQVRRTWSCKSVESIPVI